MKRHIFYGTTKEPVFTSLRNVAVIKIEHHFCYPKYRQSRATRSWPWKHSQSACQIYEIKSWKHGKRFFNNTNMQLNSCCKFRFSCINWNTKACVLNHFHFTLKYLGSTLCFKAWALPTDFSTDAILSELSRLSTSVLMAAMTRWACFLSWTLCCISSGSSMCLKSLKNCLDEGKFTNNLQKKKKRKKTACWEITEFSWFADLWIFIMDKQVFIFVLILLVRKY